MDWGAVFVLLALLTLSVLFLTQPFFDRQVEGKSLSEAGGFLDAAAAKYQSLQEKQSRLLFALQDLEASAEMGKLTVKEYAIQREAMLETGAEVLDQLKALRPPEPEAGSDLDDDPANLPRSNFSFPRFPVYEEDELEAIIMAYRHARQEKAIGICPHCKKTVKQTDRFCAGCGWPIDQSKLMKRL